MCFVSKPRIPKPAAPPPPAPILEQTAPDFTDEKQDAIRGRKTGTKKYRVGSGLAIPSSPSAASGGLNIPGGS